LIANAKYPKKHGTLSQRFKLFLDNDVFPHAHTSNVQQFRAELSQPAVKGVFQKYMKVTLKVFHYYANLDKSTMAAKNSITTINLTEWLQIAKVSGLYIILFFCSN
jgi:hypothetical protein